MPTEPIDAQGDRLVRADLIGDDGVVEVRTERHGRLAVGMSGGVPFATGNVCRHQFARLGLGEVDNGCLQCPRHRARFDVRSGRMVRGPQGRLWGFPPYSRGVQLWANTIGRLRTFDVELVDGWIALRS